MSKQRMFKGRRTGDTHARRHAGMHAGTYAGTHASTVARMQARRHAGTHTGRQAGRQAGRQTHAGTHAGRHTDTLAYACHARTQGRQVIRCQVRTELPHVHLVPYSGCMVDWDGWIRALLHAASAYHSSRSPVEAVTCWMVGANALARDHRAVLDAGADLITVQVRFGGVVYHVVA